MSMENTAFAERERQEEAKFKHDQELEFRVHSRRDKLLGLWVAEKLGYSQELAEAYAMEVVRSEFGAHDAMLEKVGEDLRSNGVEVSDTQLQTELKRLEQIARLQVIAE